MRVATIVLAAAFATTAALGTAPAHADKIQRGLDNLWLKYGLQGYDRDTQTRYRFHLTEDGVKPRTDRYASTHLDRQWTHIVPASIGPDLGTVYYDGVNGRVEITGPYSGKKTYTDFHKGFDIVMSFGAGTLYYDKLSGFAKIYKIHTDDTNMLLQPGKHNYGAPVFKGTWRKGWDIIRKFPLTRKGKHYVLFYDREAGYSVIYDFINGEKPGTRSDKATTWRKTWHTILPYTTSSVCEYCQLVDNKQMILFYDNTKGEGAFYELDGKNGKLGKLVELKKGWRKSWDTILSYSLGKKAFLLFYDKESGDVNVYKIKTNGKIGDRVQ